MLKDSLQTSETNKWFVSSTDAVGREKKVFFSYKNLEDIMADFMTTSNKRDSNNIISRKVVTI